MSPSLFPLLCLSLSGSLLLTPQSLFLSLSLLNPTSRSLILYNILTSYLAISFRISVVTARLLAGTVEPCFGQSLEGRVVDATTSGYRVDVGIVRVKNSARLTVCRSGGVYSALNLSSFSISTPSVSFSVSASTLSVSLTPASPEGLALLDAVNWLTRNRFSFSVRPRIGHFRRG